MKKFFRILIVGFLSFITTLAFATPKEFCVSYDPQFTHMQAIEGNMLDSSFLKKSTTKQKTLTKTAEFYDPKCTLKNQKLCEERPTQKISLMPESIYKDIHTEGNHWMRLAANEALKSVQHGGGPFGVVIVQLDDKTGQVIRYWTNHNHVVEWNDPTAHAEITTIRTAAKELGVVNLGHINKNQSKLSQPNEWSHCVMYSSAEPCPMCLSALYWAGIKDLAFSATRFDAAAKGVDFSDKMIYEELALPLAKRKHMHVTHATVDNALDAFNYYKRNEVGRYGESPDDKIIA